MKTPPKIILAFALSLGAACADAHLPTLQMVGVYRLPASAPEGLSGLAWLGGSKFIAVEDSGGRLHSLEILFDASSGAITNGTFTGTRSIPDLEDAEGVAYAKATDSLYVSDETGPKILRLTPKADDTSASSLPLPDVLREIRPNKSLEALAFGTDANGKEVLWTANEDALVCDGPASSTNTAATIRLFAIAPDDAASSVRAWNYRLDPAEGEGLSLGRRAIFTPFNGLAALAALGDGKLLALERICGQKTVPNETSPETTLITIRIYFVDTAKVPPNSGTFLPKTLLCTFHSGTANYEGMALGPTLPDGSRLLILVADGDTTTITLSGMNFAFSWEKALLSLKLNLREDIAKLTDWQR